MYIQRIGILSQTQINPIWSGLTNYWKFNESSGTVNYDSVGSINYTNTATMSVTGKNNYGVNVTTAGTQLYSTTMQLMSGEFTLSMWFKANSTGSGVHPFFQIRPSNWIEFIINVNFSLFASIGSSGYFVCQTNDNTVPDDTNWNHYVWTYDGSGISTGSKLYINGDNKSYSVNNTNNHGSVSGSGIAYIGDYAVVPNTYPSKGSHDEFAIWNRVLSQTEINTLYNSGNGLFY
jgi:hypothetical protein